MEALKKKWNSRRGASILLALLFLLVCMMAAASIVIAAASDAGKIDSNKKEQQKYLTLSSALTLVCNDLERVEYVGNYQYKKDPVYKGKDGAPLVGEYNEDDISKDANEEPVVHHYIHSYEQEEGDLRRRTEPDSMPEPWGLNDASGIEGVLEPLRGSLDNVFAKHFDLAENLKNIVDDYEFQELEDTAFVESFVLELKAEGDDLDRDTYGSLVDTVKIVVALRADGSIKLTGTLMEPDEIDETTGEAGTWKDTPCTMTAVLRPDPDKWPEQRLVLKPDANGGINETAPIRWKLDAIVKEASES